MNDNTPDAIPIQLPVRYDAKQQVIRDRMGSVVLELPRPFTFSDKDAARLEASATSDGSYIANVLNTYPSLIAERDKYRVALEQWKCEICHGRKEFRYAGLNRAECSACEGTGLSPIAREALKQEGNDGK